MSRLGVSPDMIDYVILTHLHLDHAGGAFVADSNGSPIPRFPNARHIIRREEWDAAMDADDRSRPVYPADRLKCLDDCGLIEFVDADMDIMPGIHVARTGGHTRGHQMVTVSSMGQTVLYSGDVFPTAGHLRPTYIAASDLYPLETLENKKELLSRIVDGGWIIAFDHDLELKFATLQRRGGALAPEKAGEPFLAALRSCKDNIDESRETTG
jgi:glyoxylase-like metal-dependent hydrolase (beta-lactamase superfamily II)